MPHPGPLAGKKGEDRPYWPTVLASLEALAVSCGFRDLEHLRRANLRAFGRIPSRDVAENERLIAQVIRHKPPRWRSGTGW